MYSVFLAIGLVAALGLGVSVFAQILLWMTAPKREPRPDAEHELDRLDELLSGRK